MRGSVPSAAAAELQLDPIRAEPTVSRRAVTASPGLPVVVLRWQARVTAVPNEPPAGRVHRFRRRRLADADGIAALLPRLAARIGVTTNALYRYVSSKDELLVLVRDAGWGVPPELI